jgi:hypothetical protein
LSVHPNAIFYSLVPGSILHAFELKYAVKEVNAMTMPHRAHSVQLPTQVPERLQKQQDPGALEIDETLWDRLWLTFEGIANECVALSVKSISETLKHQKLNAIVSLQERHWEGGKFRVLLRIPVNTERADEYKFVKPVERALFALSCDLESWVRRWRDEPNDADRILALLTFRCDGCGNHFTTKDRAARLWFTGGRAENHCSTCAEAGAEYAAKDWAAHAAAQAAGGRFFDEGHMFTKIDLQFEHGMEFRDTSEIYRVAYEASRQGITVLIEPRYASLAFAEKNLEPLQAVFTQVTGRYPRGTSVTASEAND